MTDGTEPDCWCPDSHIESGQVVDYCPQHGSEPDYSLATYPEAAKQWRAEQAADRG